ncbi:MAG TPA: coenzyme F420-0:L-glutamate ligase [Solirubrobacteraceae bacterium]|nr:coenzyme F420-0:L-glutamate ligase [Solirubrobacteraceae bacterium]
MIEAHALAGLPEVRPGDDLGGLLARAAGDALRAGEVLVVAHKVVSKAEGRVVALNAIDPGPQARRLADEHGKDPRLVQAILDDSAELLRASHGVLITRTPHGFVCANAGIDQSNAASPGDLIRLPTDPDASARALRARLRALTGAAPAVVIGDSFGRAWRHGQCDVAIGIAGLRALDDWRGRPDSRGRDLRATAIAVADQAAAAADLARDKASRQPAVVVRGLERHVTEDDGQGAAALVRPLAEDLFR